MKTVDREVKNPRFGRLNTTILSKMATHQATTQAMTPETQMIGWENPNPYGDKASVRRRTIKQRWNDISISVFRKLDRVMPSHRKYCGCSRRLLLIFCIVVLVVILALAIGLGVGLTRGSEYVVLLLL